VKQFPPPSCVTVSAKEPAADYLAQNFEIALSIWGEINPICSLRCWATQ